MPGPKRVVVDIVGSAKGYTEATEQAVGATGRMNSALETIDKKLAPLAQRGGIGGALLGGAGLAAGLTLFNTVGDVVGGAMDDIGRGIELASDKAENASKANVLFGDSYGLVEQASRTAADTVAMSSGAYLEAAGNVGNLVKNMGIAGDEAASMSTDLIQLAADMGSFNNADPTDVIEAIGSAFRGESEPIRAYGVMLDAAKIKEQAMSEGLVKGKGPLTDNAKALATYHLILKQTTAAQGDLARTADGLANKQRLAAARQEEAYTRLGDAILPLANTIMPMLTDAATLGVEALTKIAGPVADIVDGGLKVIVGAITAVENAFHNLDRAIHPNQAAMEDAEKAIRDHAKELGYDADAVWKVYQAEVDHKAAMVASEEARKVQSQQLQLITQDYIDQGYSGLALIDVLRAYQEGTVGAAAAAQRQEQEESKKAATLDTAREALALYNKDVDDFVAKWRAAGQAANDTGDFKAWSQFLADNADFVRLNWSRLPDYIQKAMRAAGVVASTGADAVTGEMGNMGDWLRSYLPGAFAVIPKQLAIAEGTVTKIAADIPGSVADGLRSQLSEVRQAAGDLRWATVHPLYGAQTVAEAQGILAGKALRDGLKSTNPAVRHQAEVTRDTVTGVLDDIADSGYVAGYDAGAALIDGLRASGVLDKVAGLFGLGGAREYHPPKGAKNGHPKKKPKHKAAGGHANEGEALYVGEVGEEMFVPETDGTIVTAGDLMRGFGRGSSGPSVVNITAHVHVNPWDDEAAMGRKVTRAIAAAAKQDGGVLLRAALRATA